MKTWKSSVMRKGKKKIKFKSIFQCFKSLLTDLVLPLILWCGLIAVGDMLKKKSAVHFYLIFKLTYCVTFYLPLFQGTQELKGFCLCVFLCSISINLEVHTMETGVSSSVKHYSARYCLWHRMYSTNNTSFILLLPIENL